VIVGAALYTIVRELIAQCWSLGECILLFSRESHVAAVIWESLFSCAKSHPKRFKPSDVATIEIDNCYLQRSSRGSLSGFLRALFTNYSNSTWYLIDVSISTTLFVYFKYDKKRIIRISYTSVSICSRVCVLILEIDVSFTVIPKLASMHEDDSFLFIDDQRSSCVS